MEYKLIELHDDNVVKAYAVYRGANPARLSQLSELTDLVTEAIIDQLAAGKKRFPERQYLPMFTTPTAYGAEIRVMPDGFRLLSNGFGDTVRECIEKRWAQTVSTGAL